MFESSIQGIRTNLELFCQAAERLQDIEKSDLPRDFTEMIKAERATEASIVALKTSYTLNKHLIDLFA